MNKNSPYKINIYRTATPADSIESVTAKKFAVTLLSSGWKFFVCDGRKGFCSYRRKIIVTPSFVWKVQESKKGYITYYFSHELAHAFTGHEPLPHGPEFMSKFKEICPAEFWHYEAEYKPRNAERAGIARQSNWIAEEL